MTSPPHYTIVEELPILYGVDKNNRIKS